MTEPKMDETFSTALRALLVEHVQAPQPRSRWGAGPRRWLLGAGAAVVIAAGGGGLAWATGAFSTLPGGQITTPLAAALTVTREGSQTVDLGARPVGANSVTFTLVCLTPGEFVFPNGSETCRPRDTGKNEMAPYSVPLQHGQDAITITAPAHARWRLTANYATTRTTPLGTNASGQTYGVENANGSPDLIAVEATDHRQGYAYASQLLLAGDGGGPPPTSIQQALAESHHGPISIPVYESDGKTQIGIFTTDASTSPCAPSNAKPDCQMPASGPSAGPSTSPVRSRVPVTRAKPVPPH
jgi:hypothetical protein